MQVITVIKKNAEALIIIIIISLLQKIWERQYQHCK